MFNIFASMFATAARQKQWDAPRHWRDDARPELRTWDEVEQTRRRMRKHLRETGIY